MIHPHWICRIWSLLMFLFITASNLDYISYPKKYKFLNSKFDVIIRIAAQIFWEWYVIHLW